MKKHKNKINRVEVIDWTEKQRFGGGRIFGKWENDIVICTDIQDDGRTLKIFIKDGEHKEI